MNVAEPRGIPLQEKLLPEYLQKLGYTTRLVGKWHLGYYTNEHTPARRGFDSFVGYYGGYVKYFNHTVTKNVSMWPFFLYNLYILFFPFFFFYQIKLFKVSHLFLEAYWYRFSLGYSPENRRLQRETIHDGFYNRSS